jgi:hypothetical protein
MTVMKTRLVHVCDFCGKGEDQVSTMVAGPGWNEESELNLPAVDICEFCIDAAYELLQVRRANKQDDPA